MKREKFPWKREYQFVEPGINSQGRIYPFDPVFPVGVSFLTTSGHRLVRMNRHEFLEVLYIFSGDTQVEVRSHYLDLKKGDVVVMRPDICHRLVHKPNVAVKLISLNFQREVIRGSGAGGEEGTYLSPFLDQDQHFPHVISHTKDLSREVLELILKIHGETSGSHCLPAPGAKTYMRSLLLVLLRHFANHLGTRDVVDRKQRYVQRLQPLFLHVDQHYSEHIEVADAARVCAMSSSHFMRFF